MNKVNVIRFKANSALENRKPENSGFTGSDQGLSDFQEYEAVEEEIENKPSETYINTAVNSRLDR